MMHRRRAAAVGALVVVLSGVVAVHGADRNPVVATITVGPLPAGVAVDPQTRRAFVVNNGNDTIAVLDTASGTLARTVTVGSGPTSLVVDVPDKRIFVTNAGWRVTERAGQVVAYEWTDSGIPSISILDAASGRLVRTVPTNVSANGAVVDADAWQMFVSANDLSSEGVGVFSAASQRSMSSRVVSGRPIAVAHDQRANRFIVVSETLTEGAIVTVLDANGMPLETRSIDPVLGWHPLAVDRRIGRAFVATATVTPNRVLRGSISLLDTRTGRLLRTIALPSMPIATAVDEQAGHLFVSLLGPVTLSDPRSLGSGMVEMLDERSGAILRVSDVGSMPGPLVVDTQRHRVLVATVGALDSAGNPLGPGTLNVLDAQTGAVIGTIPVGMAPGDIALDERAQRALVLNFGGTVPLPDAWGWLPPQLRRRLPFVAQHAQGTRMVPGSVTVLDMARL